MPGAEFHVRPTEPAFDQYPFACVVPFDDVADELQKIADHEGVNRPDRRVVPHQKMNRQDERDWQTDQVEEPVGRVQMTFDVVGPETTHQSPFAEAWYTRLACEV